MASVLVSDVEIGPEDDRVVDDQWTLVVTGALPLRPLAAVALLSARQSRDQVLTSGLSGQLAILALAWFGLRILRRLSDRQFEIAVNALLILSGLGLIL